MSSFSSQRERCAGRSLFHPKDGIHGDVDGSQPEVWSARGRLARADDVTGMRRVSESQKQLMDFAAYTPFSSIAEEGHGASIY